MNISDEYGSPEVVFWKSSLQDRTKDHIHAVSQISGFQYNTFPFWKPLCPSLSLAQELRTQPHKVLSGLCLSEGRKST